MAEEKPKGDPVFLTIAGEKVTLPGVTSLNSESELKAAANDWIAKNYKGPDLGAPIVIRTPKTNEKGGFAPGEEIMVSAAPPAELSAYTPDTFAGSLLDALASGVTNVAGILPGFDERRAVQYGQDVAANIESTLGLAGTERSFRDILAGRGTGADYLTAGLTILPFAAKPAAALATRVAPELSAAIGRFATGPSAIADEFTAAIPKTSLPPEMAAIAEPVTPAPVVPRSIAKPKPVEVPEAPVAAAEIPEAPVVPTPTIKAPEPAITPERLAEMRTNAEDVLKGMAAETPPAPVPERIGALKATNFTTPEETKQLLSDVATANKNFPEARRGTMTIEQINELSKDVDLNQILGRKVGMPLNAEQIQAAKTLAYQTADDAISKAKAWVASGGQDAAAFQEALDSLVSNTAMFETLQGASSELGRALRVVREKPSVDMSLAMKQLLEQRAKGVPVEEIMQRLATFDDPKQANEFIGKIAKPNFRDKFEEYWINSLLSGPRTHVFNLASNIGVALSSPFEKLTEVGIGAALRSPDRVTMSEFKSRMAGMLEGARDGVELAKKAFVTEGVPSGKTTVEQSRAAISGTKGKIVRLPSRFLAAQDELFKAIHSRGEVAAQAYQRAAKESSGDAQKLEELYSKYLADPTPDMLRAAKREAEYRTFQSESGSFGKWLQSGAQRFLPIRLLFPFIRGPLNLIKYGFERSPIAGVSDRFRAEMLGTPRQRNEALAKLTVGSSVLGVAMAAAMDGHMTGAGPSDPQERQALLATGWQPYSFKFGDTYIPFQRFDPFATPLGAIADMATLSEYMTDKELKNIAASLMFSVSSNIAEKTYLQGISNFMDAVAGKERSVEKAEKFVTNTALGLIPNVLRQTAVAIDPTLRDATTLLQQVQDRVPIIRGNDISIMGTNINLEAVPERIDIWGDVDTRTPSMRVAGRPIYEQFGAAAYNLLSPVQPTRTTSDPVKKEVARLGLGLERPDKKVSLSVNTGGNKPLKFEIELTDRERRQFTFASGVMAKALVARDIASPEWQRLNDDERRKLIKDRMSLSRSQFRQLIAGRAMERYLSENDDLPKIVP